MPSKHKIVRLTRSQEAMMAVGLNSDYSTHDLVQPQRFDGFDLYFSLRKVAFWRTFPSKNNECSSVTIL